jgi:hypothetical protein
LVRAIHRLREALNSAALLALALAPACGSELEGRAPSDFDTVDSDLTDVAADTAPAADTADGDSDVASEVQVDTTPDAVVVPADWEAFGIGDVGRIDGLALASSNLGFAASGPRVLRWDGHAFAPYGEPGRIGAEADGVDAVRGVTVVNDEVWAVGERGLVARRPVSGGAWTRVPCPLTVELRAIGARAGVVYVAGDDGTIARFSNDSWETLFTSPVIDLRAMWIDAKLSGDDGVYAVGTGGQLVTRVGSAWKASQIAAGSVTLGDILGLPNGTLVAVGTGHTVTVKRPEAPAWQGQATNDARERDLFALALGKDGTLRAFGEDGAVLVQDGTVWGVDTEASLAAQFLDLQVAETVPGSSALVALGGEGGGLRYDGTAWTAVSTSPAGAITDLAGDGDALYLTGDGGLFAVRTAAGWSSIPTPVAADLHAVTLTPDAAVFAVGGAGAIIRYVDGVASVIPAPVPLDLFGVAAFDGKVYACGRGGTLLVLDDLDAPEPSVTVRASGTTADLKALVVGGDGALWVAGAFGTLMRVRATGLPTPVLSGVGGSLNDLAPTATGVLVAGDNGVILRATGDGATLEHEAPGRFLYAVATAGEAAIAAGAGGFVLRHVEGAWVSEKPAAQAATFESAWIGPSGEALIGGILRVHHLESRLEPIE